MTVKEIHELYDVYVVQCEGRDCEPLDYDEFLEQMLIMNELEISMLGDEVAMARHGADVTHCLYEAEVRKREALDVAMVTVGHMLAHGDESGARGLAVHFGIFN